MAEPKEKYPVAIMPADALAYAEPKQKKRIKEQKEQPKKEIKKTYNELKVGDEVIVSTDMGGPFGRYDFHGKVVKVTDYAVMIEAPVTEEWRNYWKATLHSMAPILPVPYSILLGELGTDPFGFWDWMKKNAADKLGGWASRIEVRPTKKGSVLRYILYKGDIEKGYVKELKVGGEAKTYPGEYGGKPIPAPEMLKEEKPKKTGVGGARPRVGRKAVSKTEIEELEGKTTEELFSMITLQYDVPGKYKGYSYMGGANGLQSGIEVAIVQILANRLFGANLLVNGVYDAETMAAVKALQGRVGVTQDGYFGIDTKTALGEYLKMRAPPKEEEGEGGAPPGEKPVAPTPGEAVLGRFVFTREIDRDYVKPPKGPTQLMDENFYVKTDSGWLTAKELVRKDLNEIDKNWETDKATAATVASKENWNTRTLTRKNIGVFSWANTKKVLFPYLYASGQMVEFRTWEPLEIKNEEGEVVLRVAAGQVVQGVIREYDEGGKDGSITMEVTAVLDDFTVNGGKPIKPSGEETKPSPAVAAIPTPTVAEGEEVSDLPPPAAERDYS
ncbi:MAG: peptidoglycan-binding protein [Candidatus Anstonellales archaeon]